MAIKFNRLAQFIPQWKDNDQLPKDEQISVSYHTLTVEDMFEVQKHTHINLFAGVPVDSNDPESFQKFWTLCSYLLGKYTHSWGGIEVDGEALTTGKQIAEKLGPGHLELIMEVTNQIIAQSMGTAEQAKNSESQSGPGSVDSTLTATAASLLDSNGKEIVEMGI